ncbi:MAG: toxin-antitoxin system, antitoxin component, Xre family protein [Xenococcus sp. (in: cyanobacteria)]
MNQLSVEEIEQVEHFIDSLKKQDLDHRLTVTSSKLAESVFERVWNNPEDAEYDKLWF